MANLSEDKTILNAFQVLFPNVIKNNYNFDDGFDMNPHAPINSSKFYDILILWWNQELKISQNNQITNNNWISLNKVFKSNNNTNNNVNISDYIGFFQPKNGTCGFVAALHAILVSKIWDINVNRMDVDSKTNDNDDDDDSKMNMEIKDDGIDDDNDDDICNVPSNIDVSKMLQFSIIEMLYNTLKAGNDTIEYDPNEVDIQPKKNNNQPWSCNKCSFRNKYDSVFCEQCFTDKPSEPDNTNAPQMTSNKQKLIQIQKSDTICLVTKGNLPLQNENNGDLLYNGNLFEFKLKYIKLSDLYNRDGYLDDSDIFDIETEKGKKFKRRFVEYLLDFFKQNDFDKNFTGKGCCIRILLSLILTHGLQRCIYELNIANNDEVFKNFRDLNLIVKPYGFCSQNLVNLLLFGHCGPVIQCPKIQTYKYGFLGHDIINPGATGYVQKNYGYEYPKYPIWVIHSGTHYTTLFGVAGLNQTITTYDKMVEWLNVKNAKNETKSAHREANKDTGKPPQNGSNNSNQNGNSTNESNSDMNSNIWKCPQCGKENKREYVFCEQCFVSKPEGLNTPKVIKDTKKDEQNDNNKKIIKQEEPVHFELDLFVFNGLPPSGPIISPIKMTIITETENEQENKIRNRVISPNDCLSYMDSTKRASEDKAKPKKPNNSDAGEAGIEAPNDNSDNNNDNGNDDVKKLVPKYVKVHQLIQRKESPTIKGLYYYELAVTLDEFFQECQYWKSTYMESLANDKHKQDLMLAFDPRKIPDMQSKINEYPSNKWRCCDCYLSDDYTKKYAGYNDITFNKCKSCGKLLNECIRSIFVKYEYVPLYVRESKVDNIYKTEIAKLLSKRYRNFVETFVDNSCLPVI